ncbi:hypothetical protein D9M72_554470 [compost metagenome]
MEGRCIRFPRETLFKRGKPLAGYGAHMRDRIRELKQVAHRRRCLRGDVEQSAVADRDKRRPAEIGTPDAADKSALAKRCIGHAAHPPCALYFLQPRREM